MMQMGIFRYNPDFGKILSRTKRSSFFERKKLYNALFFLQKNLSSASLIAVRIPQIQENCVKLASFSPS